MGSFLWYISTPLLAVEGSVAKLWLFGEYEVTYLQYDLAKHQAPPITTVRV